jgi:hypothetical protein
MSAVNHTSTQKLMNNIKIGIILTENEPNRIPGAGLNINNANITRKTGI